MEHAANENGRVAAEEGRLIRAFVERGEEWAFRTLYRRHAPSMYGVALRLLGGRDTLAEEVLQTAWVRAAERLGRFRGRSSLKTWLCGITVNVGREALRRERRSPERPLDAQTALVPATRIYGDIQRVDLERAMARLPVGYREVLVLHDVEGYTHEEIARILDIQKGTSKSQLSRARRAMRAELSEEEERDHERHAL
jgi:RNA polymerase sigma-70 factor (ECF subfamily)